MKELRIAKDLSLPLEAVTQAIGILAKRRAGNWAHWVKSDEALPSTAPPTAAGAGS